MLPVIIVFLSYFGCGVIEIGITWDLIRVPSHAPFELIFPSDTLRDSSQLLA